MSDCATSTLRLPESTPGEENYQKVQAERLSAPAGNCSFAAVALAASCSVERLVAKCPELVADYHTKGAPKEINCIVRLTQFAEATKG